MLRGPSLERHHGTRDDSQSDRADDADTDGGCLAARQSRRGPPDGRKSPRIDLGRYGLRGRRAWGYRGRARRQAGRLDDAGDALDRRSRPLRGERQERERQLRRRCGSAGAILLQALEDDRLELTSARRGGSSESPAAARSRP